MNGVDKNRPEVWKDVQGFEGLYQVSNNARVKSIERYVKTRKGYSIHIPEKILKSSKGNDGYHDIGLWKDNRPKYFSLHQLVAQHFIPNPENKPTVNHKDGNKDNNFDWNLEWATYQEQMDHAKEIGLLAKRVINIQQSIENLKLATAKNCIPVYCIELDKHFPSMSEVEKELHISSDKIKWSAQSNLPYKGYTFKFSESLYII